MSGLDQIVTCGLVIRPHERAIIVDGREVTLTTGEFGIVMKLVGHPGWVLTPDQLAAEEDDVDHSTESVSVLVSRLRHKLAEAGAGGCIETVRGVGYRIRALHGEMRGSHEVSVGEEVDVRQALVALIESVVDAERSGDRRRIDLAARTLAEARTQIDSAVDD